MTDTTTTETSTEDVSGLKANNADLKTRLDKANTANRDLETRLADLEQARVDAEDAAARKSGDLEAIEKRLNDKHARALKTVQDELDAARKDRDDAVKASTDKDINDTLRSSMIENNIPKHLHGPLTDFIRKKIEVVDGVAVMDSKPLKDSIVNYWKSEEGKAYVPAPANIGTGSTGVRNATADAWTSKPQTPDEHFRFAKLSTDDPALYANLRERFGMDQGKV